MSSERPKNPTKQDIKMYLVTHARMLKEYIEQTLSKNGGNLDDPEILKDIEVKMIQFGRQGYDERILRRLQMNLTNGKENPDSLI